MASDHYSSILNQQIELVIYSEGGITWSDIENMSADELPYVIYNFKKVYDEKQNAKQEFIKTCFEFASKALETLFKLLSKIRGG